MIKKTARTICQYHGRSEGECCERIQLLSEVITRDLKEKNVEEKEEEEEADDVDDEGGCG